MIKYKFTPAIKKIMETKAYLINGLGDIMKYAANEERNFEINAENVGYTRKTTIYADLSIAEAFGFEAVKDTVKRILDGFGGDVVYITELAMCLNFKCHKWYRSNSRLSEAYCDLYYDIVNTASERLTDEDLCSFYETID